MGHEVTIDEEKARAVFDELAGGASAGAEGAPVGSGGGELVLHEPTEGEWLQIARMAAGLIAGAVTPNWSVPDNVREDWAQALAGCLDQLFPGGLGNIANWGPWAKLAYASVMWGMCGMDYETFKLKPLRASVEGEAQTVDGEPVRQPEQAAPAQQHRMG